MFLGTSHNHPEFVWTVAWHLSGGEPTNSLHYFLKGVCSPRRSHTSGLVYSPSCPAEETEAQTGEGSSLKAHREQVGGTGVLMWTPGFCIHEMEAPKCACFSESLRGHLQLGAGMREGRGRV